MTKTDIKTKLMYELSRGTRLQVGPTYNRGDIKPGNDVVICSKQPVRCNGAGRCAGPHCVGLAAFVGPPDDVVEHPTADQGWLRNTQKICLTHLLDATGQPLVPVGEQEPEPKVAEEISMSSTNRLNGDLPKSVTWEELAQAAGKKDHETILLSARSLKTENDHLKSDLIATKNDLIAAQKQIIALQSEKIAVTTMT